MATKWTNEQVAAQYRLDVQRAFETENAEWLSEERKGIAEVILDCAAKGEPHPDWAVARSSFFWDIYSLSEIKIENNSVQVLLPNGFGIYPDFIAMFGNTSVGWVVPSVSAILVDDEPRLAIELILIDYWDDDRAAEWTSAQALKPPRTYWPTDSEDWP